MNHVFVRFYFMVSISLIILIGSIIRGLKEKKFSFVYVIFIILSLLILYYSYTIYGEI